jgi:hypothetical protein
MPCFKFQRACFNLVFSGGTSGGAAAGAGSPGNSCPSHPVSVCALTIRSATFSPAFSWAFNRKSMCLSICAVSLPAPPDTQHFSQTIPLTCSRTGAACYLSCTSFSAHTFTLSSLAFALSFLSSSLSKMTADATSPARLIPKQGAVQQRVQALINHLVPLSFIQVPEMLLQCLLHFVQQQILSARL